MFSSKSYRSERSDMKVCSGRNFHLFCSNLVSISAWNIKTVATTLPARAAHTWEHLLCHNLKDKQVTLQLSEASLILVVELQAELQPQVADKAISTVLSLWSPGQPGPFSTAVVQMLIINQWMVERFALKGNLPALFFPAMLFLGGCWAVFLPKKRPFFLLYVRCQVLRSHCSE